MRFRPFILALSGALAVLAFSSGSPATPVFAASSLVSHGAPATGGTVTMAQLQAMMSKASAVTPEQLEGAKAYLRAHPFQGTIERVNPAAASPTGARGMRPNIWVGSYWWGFRIHLSNADVTSLFSAIVTYGSVAVAAALCSPGVWLMVVCGAVGAFVAWLVIDVVLQVTNNFGGCDLNIDVNWWGGSNWYCT